MTEHKKHLYHMNELSDYKISDGYPDIRGWDVKDIDHRVIGKVDNLLVNKEAQRVVYLDIEVDKSIIDAKHDPYKGSVGEDINEFLNKDGENHIIIPIGLVDLNEDSDFVYTDKIDHRTFAETKRYRKGSNINRRYENQVLDSYRRKDDTIYETPYPNDSDKIQNESRIREIMREEIRTYHNKYGNDRHEDDNDIVVSDDELQRRRHNDDAFDDDRFYERREFDDKQFRNRTPGL